MNASALAGWLRLRVRDAMEPPAPVVAADEAPSVVLARLLASGGAVGTVVIDGAGVALGLLEPIELLRHVGPAASASGRTAGELVDRRALAQADEPLLEALARLRRHGREHAAVAGAGGRPVGVLRLAAALAAGYGPLLRALEEAVPGGPAEAAHAKAGQVPLAGALLGDGRHACEVQAVLADLNDRLVRRVVDGALAGMAADGWGEPPVPFTLIQMGSAGRAESFLWPDQDHGLILDDYPVDAHTAIDRWFIAFAERLARDLARIGFPLCEGNVMATNPLWRKPLAAWLDQILYWTRSRSNQAILQADIFFDFRPVYGPDEPALVLRRHVTGVIRDARPFLAQMCWRQREQGNPLGLFGHLPGEPFDVKLWASLPLVELTRILALAHGVPVTGTRARLDELTAAGVLAQDLHEALLEDHAFLAELRLEAQMADLGAGRPPTNRIEPRTLSAGRQSRLERLFHDLDRLRRKVLGELLGTS